MAVVAQLVRAPVCGTGGRGFETPQSPHLENAYYSNNHHVTKPKVCRDNVVQ